RAWDQCANIVWKHEVEKADTLRDESNALLTFSGLFSAVVAALSAVYFPNLKPQAPDATAQILYHISAQLGSYHSAGGYSNSSIPPIIPTSATLSIASGTPSPITRLVNILWFASLVLALGAAAITISSRQW
ncbi:hypothetical protein WOLCODRAFT_45871, partial [Wolfiporia cocos MD-104 SS10]